MKTGIVALIVALLVIAGGAFLVMKKNDKKTPATTTTQTTQTSQNESNTTNSSNTSQNATDSAATTITYTDSGFSPDTITVKSGDRVTIKNTSSENLEFDSDPHPAHTNNKELNVGAVGPAESMTFTVTKKGTFGYHNHLSPSKTGTIIVE